MAQNCQNQQYQCSYLLLTIHAYDMIFIHHTYSPLLLRLLYYCVCAVLRSIHVVVTPTEPVHYNSETESYNVCGVHVYVL